jgi:outer membrane protein OmpA-like peptidoglycan-associated protein
MVSVLGFWGLLALSAQTAAELETLLETHVVTYAQATRFVLQAAEMAAISDPAEAFRFAAEKRWLPKNAAPGAAAQLEGLSLLFMRSFDLRGGIFYSITKSPHFAYRELVYRTAIQGRTDPHMTVSGFQLIFITNRILSFRGEVAPVPVVEWEYPEVPIQQEPRDWDPYQLAAEINAKLRAQGVPNTRASVTAQGGVMISMFSIQFLADSPELTEFEKARLRYIAEILIGIPGRKIMIAGHTALEGTRAEQYAITEKRAQAVASYLVFLKARRPDEIKTVGYGADMPLVRNSTFPRMDTNRRIEITILEN